MAEWSKWNAETVQAAFGRMVNVLEREREIIIRLTDPRENVRSAAEHFGMKAADVAEVEERWKIAFGGDFRLNVERNS